MGEKRFIECNELQVQRRLCYVVLKFYLMGILCIDRVCGITDFTYANFGSISDSELLFQSPENTSIPAWVNESILLTPDPVKTIIEHELHMVGRILYNCPFRFRPSTGLNRDVYSFSTSFTFSIITTSSYGNCGDGLAFVITSDKQPFLNSSGAYLGLASAIPSKSSNSSFFAVEFDTFENSEPNIDDPSASHIGININSLKSKAVLDTSGNNSCCREGAAKNTNSSQVCPLCNEHAGNASSGDSQVIHGFYPELFLYNNYTFKAWVEYQADTHDIQVWMTNRSTDERPSGMPCLSVQYNLSEIFWPEMFVGIAAASGNNFEGTVVFSWSFAIHSKDGTWQKATLISLAGTVALLAVTAGAVCVLAVAQRRKYAEMARLKMEQIEGKESMGSMPRYSYKKLKHAAHSFSSKAKVGEGGFSAVYKGVLKDGTEVAVKVLKGGVRMEEEFASEVQIISQTRHRNLLQLQGWCYERGKALLVYRFMPNGSLDSYLFGDKKGRRCLDSETRIRVVTGVAAALEYLHGGLGGCVLHRDVKAANVLLSDNFDALLGDFGLARLITHQEAVTMTIAGTPGYVAPEVIYTGKATDKADVYSFGVLALEVACGQKALDFSREMRLIDWVWEIYQKGNITDALDPKLNHSSNNFEDQQISVQEEEEEHIVQQQKATEIGFDIQWQCILHLGLLCCHPCPESRPSMRQVHEALRETIVFPLPPSKPLYPTSSELSSVGSSIFCSYSLDQSAPHYSNAPDRESPPNN